jgi:hypothetical protein
LKDVILTPEGYEKLKQEGIESSAWDSFSDHSSREEKLRSLGQAQD